MRKRALRWFGFGVPLGCLVAAALGAFRLSGGAISLYMLAQAASLGAPDAFSRCAAKQMSTKKVMGSLIVAVILALIAPAAMAIYRHCIGEITIPELLIYGAVALTTVVRCFEELFASQNDTTSATMTATLTAIGLGAAMVIISGDFSISKLGGGMMFFGSMAVVAVTSGSIAIAFSRHELPKPNFAILKEIPAAMGRLLLYPAMCAGLLWLDGWNENLLRGEARKNPSAQVNVRILTFGGVTSQWHIKDRTDVEQFHYNDINCAGTNHCLCNLHGLFTIIRL